MSELSLTPKRAAVEFHCPECKTVNPPFIFAPNVLDKMGFGHAEFITIACGAQVTAPESAADTRQCGCILTIALTAFEPDAALVAAARAAAMAQGGRGGSGGRG